jgi:hypothetical protein
MKKFLQLIILIPILVFAQESAYKNEITGVENQWHSISLNEDVLSKVSENLSDLRIYSVSPTYDTLEIPYFLAEQNTLEEKSGINFKIINRSHKDNQNYFTFKLKEIKEINEIILDFKQENFNWKIDLQGSNDQKEWFDILEDYRILSILNKLTDYSFTTLKFPNSEYAYYRINVKNEKKVRLKSATLQKTFERKIDLEEIENEYSIVNDKKNKATVIDLKFENRLPISEIELFFSDDIDYQRSVNFEYLVDSFKTEKGWRYSYRSITNSYVSSLGENKYFIDAVYTKALKITIYNLDNQALNLKDIKTKSLKYILVARFLESNNQHFMTYGNTELRSPNYDIKNFKKNISTELDELDLGKQISLLQGDIAKESIVTKWWLWAIIILIIALLGYSTLGMLKKAE